ncbi:hypothetical protein TNCT_150481 [Trichonephila clavata]|uniref:Thyroglobulin type-1 domain-containing protein n=1 Tax=Trichonephila clavata TaxID=2740835 RepID=A0A8X6FRC8_TRICU|nr:hypothetical protein TNCT_150481 [Trichonephila clavata]
MVHFKLYTEKAKDGAYGAKCDCKLNTDMKLLLCVFIVFSLCFVLIFAKSECEIRHKKALKEKEKWIPMCAESGDFEDMQCLEENAGCFCVKPDGTPITKPNSTLKTCKCLIHRENVASRS